MVYHCKPISELIYNLSTFSRTPHTIDGIYRFRMALLKKQKKLLEKEVAKRTKELIELREIEKRSSEEAIASKERELASMAMAAHEKNSLLNDLEQKVGHIEKRMDDEVQPDLKDLKRAISNGYSMDGSWNSFLHSFQDVHPHFFNKLKREYAALTNDDLKLCAYLKIGMSNKKVATVAHLTMGSVKTKTNRLKKKLEMGADENLSDFMLKYS